MQTLTWIGGLFKLMIFFSLVLLRFHTPEFYAHYSTSEKEKIFQETRDTIRRLKPSLSFSRRHYSMRIRKIITFSFFFSSSPVSYLFNYRVREKTSF